MDEVPSRDSSKILFLAKFDSGSICVEKPMPPLVLIEAEIEVFYQRKESENIFAKTYRGVTGQEPSDAEISHHLECMGQSDVVSGISLSDHYRADVLAHKEF